MSATVHKFPAPKPRVHQCGCGSQAFHLYEDGSVICLQCRYIITTLRVEPITLTIPNQGEDCALQERT